MKAEDVKELRKLIGKKVVDVRINTEDPDDFGFDLVFDDGTVLEIYDLKEMGLVWTVSEE